MTMVAEVVGSPAAERGLPLTGIGDLGFIKWPGKLLALFTPPLTIDEKYATLGGASGFLGQPKGPEQGGANGGRLREFSGGMLYWCSEFGAHELHGEFLAKYQKLRAEGGFLGYPATDVLRTAAARNYSIFQGGVLFSHPLLSTSSEFAGALSPVEVHGAILAKYKDLNAYDGLIGYPQSDEVATPDGQGRMNLFEHGDIYWTANTGAHEVHGPIREKYDELGGPAGLLGFPTTDEMSTPDGYGKYTHFTGGAIYWTPATGAHEVHGDIRGAWAAGGWEKGPLGYPVSDEFEIPGTQGRRSVFTGGGLDWYPGKGVRSIGHFKDLAALDWRFRLNPSGTSITFFPWVANAGTMPIDGPGEVAIGVQVGSVMHATGAGMNQMVPTHYHLGIGQKGILGQGITVPFSPAAMYSFLEYVFNIAGEPWVGNFCDACFRKDLQTGRSNNGRRFFWPAAGANAGEPFEPKTGHWILSQSQKQLAT